MRGGSGSPTAVLLEQDEPVQDDGHPKRAQPLTVPAGRRESRPSHDVRVARVHRPCTVMSGKEFEGAPRVEQVIVEMDPIGFFDGEYRSFKDIEVHRVWTLQRVNGGPWRITSVQGI